MAYNHYICNNNKFQQYSADIPSLRADNPHLELILIITTDLPFVPQQVLTLILLNSEVRNFGHIHIKESKLKLPDALFHNKGSYQI